MAEAASVDTTIVTVPINHLRGAPHLLQARLALPALPEGLVFVVSAGHVSLHDEIEDCLIARLHESWFGTFHLDLLLDEERGNRPVSYDLPLLAERILAAGRVIDAMEYTRHLPLASFGSGTGAGAVLLAATREPRLTSVVGCCGWMNLGPEKLARVEAATLLIVNQDGGDGLAINQRAYAGLRCEKRLALFGESAFNGSARGLAEEAAWLATEWFAEHLDR